MTVLHWTDQGTKAYHNDGRIAGDITLSKGYIARIYDYNLHRKGARCRLITLESEYYPSLFDAQKAIIDYVKTQQAR